LDEEVFMRRSSSVFLTAIALGAMICACGAGGGARVPESASRAATRIAAAVEAHRAACGGGAAEPTEAERDRISTQLGLTECSTRTDGRALDHCLRAIGEQPCSARGHDIADISACRVGAICGTIEEGTI
jgi:hypothetical protein